MISPFVLSILEHLPKGFVKFAGNKIFDGYVDKYANLKISGMENLNGIKRPIIFVCNHLSNSDGVVLNKVLRNEDISFVAGVKLSGTPLTNLGFFAAKTIPIKPNSADKEAVSKIVHTLKSGGNILIFPEGTRSRTKSMLEGKKGVVLFQKLTKAPIIPIGLTGTEDFLPINDKDMGEEKFQNANVTMTIGKPIYYEDLPQIQPGEDRHTHEKVQTDFIMKKIAELIPESYRGVYKDYQ